MKIRTGALVVAGVLALLAVACTPPGPPEPSCPTTTTSTTSTTSTSSTTTTPVAAGIETSVATLAVAEGSTATVGIRLTVAPVATVTVSANSSDLGAVGVSPTALTFTPANWSVMQTVTVSGLQDVDATDEVVQVSFSAPGLPTATVTVTVTDDDASSAAIETSVATLGVLEGGTATLGVRLTVQPVANRTVSVVSGDPTLVGVSPTSLTFTPANWSVMQTVTVSGLQDANATDEVVQVSLSTSGLPTATVAVTVTDDDVVPQGIQVSVATLGVLEGGTATLGVRLAVAPVAPVTVSVFSGAPGTVGVSPTTLTFTTANWNVMQTVTVSGVEDANATSEVVQVSLSASGVPTASVTVNVTDNEF